MGQGSQLRLLFTAAANFLVVYTLWLLHMRTWNTGEGLPPINTGFLATLRALWMTGQLVVLYLIAWWLSRRPQYQQTAAEVCTVLLGAFAAVLVMRFVNAPAQVTSPLMPDSLVDVIRVHVGAQLLVMLAGLIVVVVQWRRRALLRTTVACFATFYGLQVWELLWLHLPDRLRMFPAY